MSMEKKTANIYHLWLTTTALGLMIQKKFLMKIGTSLKNCTPLGTWTLIVRSSVIFFNVDFQLPWRYGQHLWRRENFSWMSWLSWLWRVTTEFYRAFWDIISTYAVNSFNYAFNTGTLAISQRQGVVSLIPKKKKDIQYLENWRPV